MKWVALLLVASLSGCIMSGGDSETTIQSTGPQAMVNVTWMPAIPMVGQEVTFEAAVSSTASGDELQAVLWTIESKQYDTQKATHTFAASGTHDIEFAVDTAKTGVTRFPYQITVVADAPVVQEGAPLSIHVQQSGDTVAFSYTWSEAADLVFWDFGDGQTSQLFQPTHTYQEDGVYTVNLRASGSTLEETNTQVTIVGAKGPTLEPHVIVGVADTGINPYHELYYRPERTAHPCTYVKDFPCDIPALDLSIGEYSTYQQAFDADRDLWNSVKVNDWYWIPKTVFVAVHCDGKYGGGGICILDDTHPHGTGTTSSVLMENPDALLAFIEYDPSSVGKFAGKKIPVDIVSISWGSSLQGVTGGAYPLPLGACPWSAGSIPIYVKSSGNDPGISSLADCWSGSPDLISVGGASAQQQGQEILAYKDMDVVSYFCRPTAETRAITAMRSSYCGTSFSAPTVAGGLSKAIYDIRSASGYTGSIEGNMVDPILGISAKDIRDAMNRTASYDPKPEYTNGCSITCIPLNPAAPYTQWGWGFYDGTVALDTSAHFLDAPAPEKSVDTVTYMEAQYAYRQAMYG